MPLFPPLFHSFSYCSIFQMFGFIYFFLCVLWFCTCTFILIHVLVLVYCSLSEGSPHICVFLTMLVSLHCLSISCHFLDCHVEFCCFKYSKSACFLHVSLSNVLDMHNLQFSFSTSHISISLISCTTANQYCSTISPMSARCGCDIFLMVTEQTGKHK